MSTSIGLPARPAPRTVRRRLHVVDQRDDDAPPAG